MAPGLPGPLASGWSQGGGWDVQLSCEEERALQLEKGILSGSCCRLHTALARVPSRTVSVCSGWSSHVRSSFLSG